MRLLGGCPIGYMDDAHLRIVRSIRAILAGIWQAQKASLAEPLRKMSSHYDDALVFVALGNLLGYSTLSTYYSRLVLVHLLPQVISWRRRVLKERDVLDRISE